MYVCMYVDHVYQLNFVGLIDGTLCPDQTRDHPGDIWAQITGVGREFQSADSDLDWKYSASWTQMKSDKLQLMCTPSISRTHIASDPLETTEHPTSMISDMTTTEL